MKSRKIIGIFTILTIVPILFGLLFIQAFGGSEESKGALVSGMWLTLFIRCYLAIAAGILIFSGKKLGYQLGVVTWGYIIFVNLMDLVSLFTLPEGYAFIGILVLGKFAIYLAVSAIPFFLLIRDLYLLRVAPQDEKPKLEFSLPFWGIYTAIFLGFYFGGGSLFERKQKGYDEQESNKIQWHVLNLPQSSSSAYQLLEIIWNDDRFILASENEFLMTSQDGINWQETDVSQVDKLKDVAHKDKRHVYTGRYNFRTSDDGICWERRQKSLGVASKVITNGSHFFYASADKMYRSVNGVDWEAIGSVPFEIVPKLRWNGSAIIADVYRKRWFSFDGVVWQRVSTARENLTSWKGKLFSTISTGNISRTSRTISDFALEASEYESSLDEQGDMKDLSSDWKRVLRPKSSYFVPSTDGFLEVNGLLFAYGDHISWSDNGNSWGGTALPDNVKGSIKRIVYGNGIYVAIAQEQIMLGVNTELNGKLEPLIKQANSYNLMATQENINRKKRAKNYNQMSLKQRTEFYYYPDGFFQSNKREYTDTSPENIGASSNVKNNKPEDDRSVQKSAKEMLNVLFAEHPDTYKRLEKELTPLAAVEADASSKALVQSVLEQNAYLLSYDVEAGTYPVPYDWLLSEYAVMAKNYGIEIKDTSMEMVKNQCGDSELYRLRWSINDTTYGLDFYDESDWFTGVAENALNTSLFEQGYQVRFVGLDTGDQIISYILAKPELIEESNLYRPRPFE